jgi:hypothetical protein
MPCDSARFADVKPFLLLGTKVESDGAHHPTLGSTHTLLLKNSYLFV